ncbi:MAG: hypothetical protein REI96_11615 [Flavobacterium nitrogenifigens]|uniref:hypothetical protein n=1 Tax=Flavobacterium nitrogenifigens TaxID=1617283 RepID=UPI00280802AA|nr:hypothetical protein [Flavobacterium nitrogenifigens]MDQ8013089.1 hypothetical protein [Flavobacterium nitrogenifigens]
MRKLLCYIILVFAIGGLISESMHNLMDLKLIYYNLDPAKYYEKDKLYVYKKENNNSSNSSGNNSWYYGVLEKQKINANIYYSTSYLMENTLLDKKRQYLKVWYCKNANKTILRDTNELHPTIYIQGIITYILILLIIPCLICVLKKK